MLCKLQTQKKKTVESQFRKHAEVGVAAEMEDAAHHHVMPARKYIRL